MLDEECEDFVCADQISNGHKYAEIASNATPSSLTLMLIVNAYSAWMGALCCAPGAHAAPLMDNSDPRLHLTSSATIYLRLMCTTRGYKFSSEPGGLTLPFLFAVVCAEYP